MFDTDRTQVSERSIVFKTPDGAELVGRLFLPSHAPFAAVVLNGATGVPQSYYAHFARWLAAERGLACLTFDYRDVERSWSGPLRQSTADMTDWGTTDQLSARQALARAVPDTPLWVIGHSLGAMTLPNQRNFEGVARVIGVASGIVHHSDHPWPYRAIALLFWFGAGPVATAVTGYLPGKRLRFGENLPAGVYWQWRRWCTSRTFYDTDLGARLPEPAWDHEIPVRLIGFSDDDLIPPHCVHRLAERGYGGKANVTVIATDGPVGHLSAFARRNAALWPQLLEG
ncbi:hypothetical protein [uncultured Tateyamaria sp.]|uniref:alpha/beta hydrolase family protein n=1 Tax=Tateyamaria sp. 1078 TaxID=3417464 RepID=UPI002630A667|nr:hypothetical protein [uncultured Tateyamaria sp.]